MSNVAEKLIEAPFVESEASEEEERVEFFRQVWGELGDDPEIASGADTDLYLDSLLERMKEAEGEIARNDEIAQRKIDMIEGWRAQANRTAERNLEWIRQMVESIAAGYEFGKKKSRALPHGTFGFRKVPDKVEILDMDAAVAFAEAHGLEIKKSVNRTPLKKYVEETGEIPPGTSFLPGGDVFYVRTSEGS